MNPYKDLGVMPDATPEDIKKAYRSLAKKHHPDTGGNTVKMATLAKAYDVLSDPDRRSRYDETGQTETPDQKTPVTNRFSELLLKILVELDNANVSESIKRLSQKVDSEVEAKMREYSGRRAKMQKALLRVKKAPEDNLVEGLIKGQILALDREEKTLLDRLEIERKAIAMFDDYEFEEPKETWQGINPTGAGW